MTPDEAAAFWYVRRSQGLTDHEEQLHREWLGRGVENAEAWADVEHSMEMFDSAGDDEILRAMRAHAVAAKPSSWFRPQLAAAAAVILMVAAGVLLSLATINSDSFGPDRQVAAAAITYATTKAEMRTVMLPDGSRMTLDAETAVEIRFTADARQLRLLRGRAFFDAARDSRRAFYVVAGGRRILALGTKFDVRFRRDGLSVTLVAGRVSVSKAGSPDGDVVLKPGQQFIEREGTRVIRSEEGQLQEVLDWQKGFVTFDDETLQRAVDDLNRYSRDQLIVSDPAVGALRISGRFRSGDAERFARVVGEIHPVDMVRSGPGRIELVRRD